ncbi:hypothetical protein NVV43_29155, partial [Escherichia marmotae]|nr:hypothetical protein [Escherichia marmotae]
MAEIIAKRSIAPERARVSFGIDPLGTAAAMEKIEDDAFDFAGAAHRLAADFTGPVLEADGRPYHDRGGS